MIICLSSFYISVKINLCFLFITLLLNLNYMGIFFFCFCHLLHIFLTLFSFQLFYFPAAFLSICLLVFLSLLFSLDRMPKSFIEIPHFFFIFSVYLFAFSISSRL